MSGREEYAVVDVVGVVGAISFFGTLMAASPGLILGCC